MASGKKKKFVKELKVSWSRKAHKRNKLFEQNKKDIS